VTLHAVLARTRFEQGRHEEAEEFVEHARLTAASDDAFTEVLWRTTQARLLAARGELEEAERSARDAVELAGGTDALNLHADSLVDLAEILAAREREREAGAVLEEAVRLYAVKGNDVARKRAMTLRREAVLDP
jgi:ATP/maltotriose-dependent transcriptional regulator MalT